MRPLLALVTSLAALVAAEGTVVVDLGGSQALRPEPALFQEAEPSLYQTTVQLRKALGSPETTIVLDLATGFAASSAAAEELASVVRQARSEGTLAGKKVIALVDAAEDPVMILAATCDEVVMADAGLLSIDGLGLENYYFADAMAKVGLRFRAVASGDHKTAHEPFTRNGPSPTGLRELEDLAKDLDGAVIALSQRPDLDAAALVAARAKSPQTPTIAKATGLVGSVAESGAWFAALPAPVRHLGDDDGKHADLSGMAGLMQVWQQVVKGDEGPRHLRAVAVVELEGEITDDGSSSPGRTIAGLDTAELMDDLADDERIKAVVLRINSPGGSAGASDRVHHAVRRLAGHKPVVALFDQYAASGGYYIGCAADEIQVHRTTITGSIGVFALVPDASGTLDLLGIHRVGVTTGPRADLFSPTAPFTPDRENALRQVIEDVDQRFQGLVADRRHIPRDRIGGLAGGRVYTGDQAIANGLADSLGTLATAVVAARKRAGIDEKLPIERYPRPKGLLQRLGLPAGGSQSQVTALAGDLLPPALRAQLSALPRLATSGRPVIMTRAALPGIVQ